MSIIEKFTNISAFMGSLFEFVQKNDELSKDFDEYLKTLSVNNPSQSAIEGHLLTYIFERQIDGKTIFDFFENKTDDKILLNALKNTISGYFSVEKIHKNGFVLNNLLNEKVYDVVSLVKMTNFRGIYQGQYISSRIFELEGVFYLLEISDVYSNSAKDNLFRYLIAKIIQEPEVAYLGNQDKEEKIKIHAQKTSELFVNIFGKNEIITQNECADEILNILNDNFENNSFENYDIQKYIVEPQEYKYFKVSEFTSDYNNFLENSLSGFSSHSSKYDVGIVANNSFGLYVLPFWGTINKIYELNTPESIEGSYECIKYYLENDKIPLFVLEILNARYPNFLDLTNKILNSDYDFQGIINEYKSMYLVQNIYSPTSVLYTSRVFLDVMGYLEKVSGGVNDNENFKNVGRNDLCPCGSGKKYKNCCLNK